MMGTIGNNLINEGVCEFESIMEPQLPSSIKVEPMALLPPDHPLLQKFQQSLGQHLRRTKLKLENEIADIKCQVRVKEQRREEQGLSLYEIQKKVLLQGDQINEITGQIEHHIKNRITEKNHVESLKTEFDEKNKLKKTEKMQYHKNLIELEHLQTLGSNITKWAYNVENEVKNAKHIVSRDAQLQQQLSEEKKKSDILFYRLDAEVKKRETELNCVCEEEQAVSKILEILNMSIADANTDLEALQNEFKRLTQAWSEVIVAIQLRDKILFQVTDNIRKEKEFIKLNMTGIQSIRKQIKKEMKLTQKLEAFRQRLGEDFNGLKRECNKEANILTALQAKLEELPIWLSKTEKNFQEANREGCNVQAEIRKLNLLLDKQQHKKFKIEQTFLKFVQDQLFANKANEYRMKLLNKSQEQRRKADLTLSQTQNQLASAMVDLEKFRGQLFICENENTQLQKDLDTITSKSDSLDNDLKSMQAQVAIKMNRFEKINRFIEMTIKSMGDIAGNPTELKIRQIEKSIHNAELQIREHQQFWIMLQNHFVNLSQKRCDQLNEIQVTRKQLAIIKQKSLKIDQDLQIAETRMKELSLNIQKFTSKLELLNEKFSKKRQIHESQGSESEIEHLKLTDKLKDKEMSVLNIEADINGQQINIKLHTDMVIQLHSESLSWETKYKLIEETIQWFKSEQSLKSESFAMKNEIHRMNIRYAQLKKAQEKLVQDLQHCVMHREQIFINASVKEVVEAKIMRGKSFFQNQMKVVDLRNKIKYTQNEKKVLNQERLVDIISKTEEIDRILMKSQEDLKKINDNEKMVRSKIDGAILKKHANLEQIVRKQNRAKAYRNLCISKQMLKIPRSETILQSQTQCQKEINDIILQIVQICISDYSEKNEFFKKLLHIVKD